MTMWSNLSLCVFEGKSIVNYKKMGILLFDIKLFKYNDSLLLFMCETLDEIHEAQIIAVIARFKKQREIQENPMEISVWT